jgi:very-short-patch-repair endonuclease
MSSQTLAAVETGTPAGALLERAQQGRALSVFCENVGLARRQVRAAAEEEATLATLVALEWDVAPSLAHELDEIRDALARAAASLWPNWYITAEQRFERARSADVDPQVVMAEVLDSSAHPSAGWLRRAWECCRSGKLPILPGMTATEQVRQLSRALDPKRLIFALSVLSDSATPARVRGLGRAAEWLARETQAKTLLLVPATWRGHSELDPVAYGSVWLQAEEPAHDLPPDSFRGPSLPVEHGYARDRGTQLPNVVVGPFAGGPHPGSDVERALYERLMSDAELRDLFEYNQRLTGLGDKRYIVDLVWRSGGLIVELDGPEHHGHMTYVKDRDRDYRMLMHGYATLRIANDEICVDVELAVTKIRNVVRHLKALGWKGTQ